MKEGHASHPVARLVHPSSFLSVTPSWHASALPWARLGMLGILLLCALVSLSSDSIQEHSLWRASTVFVAWEGLRVKGLIPSCVMFLIERSVVDKATPSSSLTHFVVLGMEPASSYRLDRCSTTEQHPRFTLGLRHSLAELKQALNWGSSCLSF